MSVGVVVSEADAVAERIAEHLLDLRDWASSTDEARPPDDGGGTVRRSAPFELRTFAELHLSLEGAADAFADPDLLAFASRHAGETGPLLTAHFTGNFGPAEYGGEDGELSLAAPAALDRVRAAFDEHAPAGYDAAIEATHHGPSDVGAPSLFVELGSGPEQWEDPAGARAVARAILSLADLADGGNGADIEDGVTGDGDRTAAGRGNPLAGRTLVGFGGGHYARRFERVLLETGWQVGHVAPDWGLDAMGDPHDAEDVVRQAFERSGAERALLDGDHPELAAVVEDLGYDVVGETWVRAVDGVPLGLVSALEADLGTVEEGLRFGEPARDDGSPSGGADGRGSDYAVVDLPGELLAEASGVDPDRTGAAVEKTCLAFETGEGGTPATGRAAVADREDRDDLVGALVAVLEDAHESVERDGDVVRVRETAFDPELARELGVPEGPAFGRLADGEPVEVGGRTVDPDDVTVERTRTFSL